MATKRPKAPSGTGIRRVIVEDRDRPEPVKVTVDKTRPRAKKSKTPMADLIRQGIAERSFV